VELREALMELWIVFRCWLWGHVPLGPSQTHYRLPDGSWRPFYNCQSCYRVLKRDDETGAYDLAFRREQ
jgi:hypothetical protein